MFFYASSHRINLLKSNLLGIVVDIGEVMLVAAFTSFRPAKLPFSYLGLLLGVVCRLLKVGS